MTEKTYKVVVHYKYDGEATFEEFDNIVESNIENDWYFLFAEGIDVAIREYGPGVVIATEWAEQVDEPKTEELFPADVLTQLEEGTKVEDVKPVRIPNYSYGFGDLLSALYGGNVPAVNKYSTDKKENDNG